MLFTLALAVGLCAPSLTTAQDDAKKAKATLKVGDPAPPLKVSKWLQGKEVKSLEKGNVYVVEFWATWCGPCIVMMPHMSHLQQEYREKGVTFIGFTAKDPNNTAEKVEQFVEKRGPKLKYTFAFADDRATYDAWMTAADQKGIPCCFVIGRDLKIAYIGHPMYLDEVLPKVETGTWKAEDAAAIEKVGEEVDKVFNSFRGDAETALKTLAEFEKNHPKLAGIPYFKGPKLGMLLKAKKTEEARKFAEHLIDHAVKDEDSGTLQSVSAALSSPGANGDKQLLALSLKAAEAMLKIAGEKDAVALYFFAEAQFANGNKAKAKEYGGKAIAAATNPGLKAELEKRTKKYSE
jgi:thiol-disulfide isomerase/thioredoxin